MHKLMQVVKERNDTRPWAAECSSTMPIRGERHGGEHGGERERAALDKTPFVAAVELKREDGPMRMPLSWVSAFRSEGTAAWSRRHLGPGSRCDVRRLRLLGCHTTRTVLSPAFLDRKWTSKPPTSGAHLGQHHPSQHQALVVWHLSPPELQAPATLTLPSSPGSIAASRTGRGFPVSYSLSCAPPRCFTAL